MLWAHGIHGNLAAWGDVVRDSTAMVMKLFRPEAQHNKFARPAANVMMPSMASRTNMSEPGKTKWG